MTVRSAKGTRSKRSLLTELKTWKHCTRCDLHKTCRNHVLYDGVLPAEVLFIGEAPGDTEDTIGKPFVGRSGKILRKMIAEHLNGTTYCITNVVACVPWSDDTYSSVRAPTQDEARECRDRVELTLQLCRPKKIVLLGNSASKHFKPRKSITGIDVSKIPTIKLYHPAYILRNGGKNSLMYKKVSLRLRDFINEE